MLTTLTFIEDNPLYNEEKPFRLVGFPNMPSDWQTNCKFVDQPNIVVLDARSHEKDFVLDDCGFKFIQHQSQCCLDIEEFGLSKKNSQNLVKYLEESILLAKQQLGISRVTCFDWRIRENSMKPVVIPTEDSENVRHYTIPPAANIHCDFSNAGGWERLAMHLTNKEVQRVRDGLWRVRFVNLWRPLKPVENAPLVLCDSRTVFHEDLVEVDKVLPNKVEHSFYLKYRDYHKWFMLSNQQPDEVIFFNTWDSVMNEKHSNVPPHGAGLDIGKGSTPPRQSIEVRLLVMSPS
ncbi:hypothetical protein B0O99DRAFT_690768 [Bisporella sp. PMI_857]|nr:hypothetical protein B0O99DRAFT_690768 [Bisporella sp. PMI_857]